jgi:ribosomal protein S18 acetylase RimI-like enzyme
VAHAQQLRDGDLTVDVNEQNPAARGFYEALGFVVVGRSPLDEGGRPFPVLHMRRPTTSDSSGAPSHSSHSATSGALASVDAADPADFHLRIAAMEDLPALRDVFRRSSLSNEGDRQSLLSHPDALEFSDRAVADGRVRVAVVADRLVGFATVLGTGQIGELEDLFVDPDWMRRGIATELVLDALANAREQGVARIEVTANEHALAFYESVGFISDGISETRFGRGHRMHVDVPPSPGAALPSKPSRKD